MPRTARRVLITGGSGTVAGGLVRAAGPGIDLHVTVRRTDPSAEVSARAAVHRVDLTEPGAVDRLVREVAPDVVVHTAYTMGSRPDIVDATAHVAGAAGASGAALVHLSTDVVFGGDAPPYGEDDPLDPAHEYGACKADAERAAVAVVTDVCITRTSLVVSIDPCDAATTAFAHALRAGREVTLFSDEYRQPIRAVDLAAELWALLGMTRTERAGIWHLPGPERLSRLELGRRLAAALGLDPAALRSGSAAEHPSPRPRDTMLTAGRRAALGVTLRPVGE